VAPAATPNRQMGSGLARGPAKETTALGRTNGAHLGRPAGTGASRPSGGKTAQECARIHQDLDQMCKENEAKGREIVKLRGDLVRVAEERGPAQRHRAVWGTEGTQGPSRTLRERGNVDKAGQPPWSDDGVLGASPGWGTTHNHREETETGCRRRRPGRRAPSLEQPGTRTGGETQHRGGRSDSAETASATYAAATARPAATETPVTAEMRAAARGIVR
jgi:hypothetical protein